MAQLKATSITGGLTISGDTTLSDGSIICPKDDAKGILPHTNNWGQIGSSDKKFYRIYATNFYGQLHGQAASANLLALHNTSSTVSTEASDWPASFSNMTYVWRQRWKDTNLSTDTGDLVLALRKAGEGSTELCMALDGDYYVHGNKCLHEGNYTSYCAAKDHTHNYAGSSSAGGKANSAATADSSHTANYLMLQSSNEINFGGATNVTGMWFNYRNADTGNASGNSAMTAYNFGNKNGGTSGVTLNASNFSGLAAKATADASGNVITSTYSKTSHSHSLSSLGAKYTTILSNGSSASSISWSSGAYDFIVGISRPNASNTPCQFVIPVGFTGEMQIADDATYSCFNITATSMAYSRGNGAKIICAWGVNVV